MKKNVRVLTLESEQWEFLRDALSDGLAVTESEFIELDVEGIIREAKRREE